MVTAKLQNIGLKYIQNSKKGIIPVSQVYRNTA